MNTVCKLFPSSTDLHQMQPYPAGIRGYEKPTSEAVNYWTLLILSPPCFYTRKWRNLFTQVWSLQETMLDRIQELFTHLIKCWVNIVNRFDQLIIEHDRVFYPEVHTRLASDDPTFSLSRKYAWAISCFLAFDASIEDAIRQWDEWNTVWIEPCLQSDEFPRHQDLRSKVETVKGSVFKLRNIHYRIQELAERTNTLRDGVCPTYSSTFALTNDLTNLVDLNRHFGDRSSCRLPIRRKCETSHLP